AWSAALHGPGALVLDSSKDVLQTPAKIHLHHIAGHVIENQNLRPLITIHYCLRIQCHLVQVTRSDAPGSRKSGAACSRGIDHSSISLYPDVIILPGLTTACQGSFSVLVLVSRLVTFAEAGSAMDYARRRRVYPTINS